MIDLDKANIKEFNGEMYNFESQFKFKKLLSYSTAVGPKHCETTPTCMCKHPTVPTCAGTGAVPDTVVARSK